MVYEEEKEKDFGVLYFVDENPRFRQMMSMSIQSLRRFHPDWPIKIIECPSYPVPPWKKLYRALSFWKWEKRDDRAGQDIRIVVDKAAGMIDTPFKCTLYLDVDTIVLKGLDGLREKAMMSDVLVTPLPWKAFKRIDPSQPERWPYMMAGIAFYSSRFVKVYRSYVDRLLPVADSLPAGDQFIFSLACEQEKSVLDIVTEPTLQLDVLNLAQELGTDSYPQINGLLDLKWEGLSRFHIFHYNEFKPQYMKQIKEVWGYSYDE
jgi:hypothetical protein